MSILLDIALLVICFVCIVSGVSRGFVRSVMNIVTLIAAIFCGYLFTPSLSAFMYERFINNKVAGSVSQAFSSLMGSGEKAIGLEQLFTDRPDAIAELAERYNNKPGDVVSFFESIKNGDALSSLSEFMAEPVARTISQVLAFLLIFIVVVVLLKIVTVILDIIFKLPVLNTLNRTLGFVFGIVCAFLYASIIALVIEGALPAMISLFPEAFNATTFDNTVILKWISENNIFSFIKIFIEYPTAF